MPVTMRTGLRLAARVMPQGRPSIAIKVAGLLAIRDAKGRAEMRAIRGQHGRESAAITDGADGLREGRRLAHPSSRLPNLRERTGL